MNDNIDQVIAQRDTVIAQAERMRAERDYYKGKLGTLTKIDYGPAPGTVWTLTEDELAEHQAGLDEVDRLCSELVFEGKLELTGETRNGRPVYRAVGEGE
jgi:hypothetical protein